MQNKAKDSPIEKICILIILIIVFSMLIFGFTIRINNWVYNFDGIIVMLVRFLSH